MFPPELYTAARRFGYDERLECSWQLMPLGSLARRTFFVDSIRGGAAELRGDEARHLTRVLRVEPGQRFEISDNQQAYLAEIRSEEHTSELQSLRHLVCRLLLEKKKNKLKTPRSPRPSVPQPSDDHTILAY